MQQLPYFQNSAVATRRGWADPVQCLRAVFEATRQATPHVAQDRRDQVSQPYTTSSGAVAGAQAACRETAVVARQWRRSPWSSCSAHDAIGGCCCNGGITGFVSAAPDDRGHAAWHVTCSSCSSFVATDTVERLFVLELADRSSLRPATEWFASPREPCHCGTCRR